MPQKSKQRPGFDVSNTRPLCYSLPPFSPFRKDRCNYLKKQLLNLILLSVFLYAMDFGHLIHSTALCVKEFLDIGEKGIKRGCQVQNVRVMKSGLSRENWAAGITRRFLLFWRWTPRRHRGLAARVLLSAPLPGDGAKNRTYLP